jgi:hypothetical protein
MRTEKTFTLLAAFITLLSISALGQATSETDSLSLAPNRRRTVKEGTGNYTVVVTDTISRQLFNGLNVSNMLRGHVPNMTMGSSINSSVSGFRNESPMVLIDGIPFNNSIGGYYNLNAFNFSSIAAASSGNALALYGGQGASGAIILESKNGRDVHQAQFEINSTTAFTRLDQIQQYGYFQVEEEDRLMFSNAIAYAQDYGKVDARVSYINNYLPDGSSTGERHEGDHSFKVNTGFDFSKRFSARVVADGFSRSVSADSYYNDDLSRSLTGNVFLHYRAGEWLTFTSQSNVIKSHRDINRETSTGAYTFDDGQRRALTNLLVTFRPTISPDVSITFVTGGQLERQISEQETFQTSGDSYNSSWSKRKGKARAWVNQINFQVRQSLFFNLNYRYDYWVYDSDHPSTYSADVAFHFKKALRIPGQALTSGILRASYGKTKAVETMGYPYQSLASWSINPNPSFPPTNYVDAYLEPTQRRSFEFGTDLYFLDSRLRVQSTIFNNRNNQTLAYFPFPIGPNGVSYLLADIGENRAKGVETVIGYDFYKRSNNVITAKAIYASYKYEIEPKNEDYLLYAEASNVIPDWTGSLLMQFRFSHFFGQLLATHQSGGNYFLFSLPNQITQIDFTQTWLRDIAVGYAFSNITLSLSGRNLWEIHAKEEHEAYEVSRTQKALMLSASLRF